MFSARQGFFYVTTATINDGRITISSPTSTYYSLDSNPVGTYGSCVYDASGNFYILGQWIASYENSIAAKINEIGTLGYSRTLTSSLGRTMGGPAINPNNNELLTGGWMFSGSQNNGSFIRLTTTGSTGTGASGLNNTGVLIGAMAVDTTNNHVYYFANGTKSSGNDRYIVRSTSLTSFVPAQVRQNYPPTGRFTTNQALHNVTNNKIATAGQYFNGSSNFHACLQVFAGNLSSSTTIYGYTLSSSVGDSNFFGIAESGGNYYCMGEVANPTYTSRSSSLIAKYDYTGSTLLWSKTLTTTSTTSNRFWRGVCLSDGSIITCGTDTGYTNRVILVKFDTDGNIVWSRYIQAPGGVQPQAITYVGNYMYVGFTSYNGSANDYVSMKLPVDGTIPGSGTYTVSSKTFTYATNSVSTVANSLTTGTQSSANGSYSFTAGTYSPTNSGASIFTTGTGTI